MRSLFIGASKVSTILEKNIWESKDEFTKHLWKKYSPDTYKHFVNKFGKEVKLIYTVEEQVEYLESKYPNTKLKEKIDNLKNQVHSCDDFQNFQTQSNDLLKNINSKIKNYDDTFLLNKIFKQLTATTWGTLKEDKAIKLYQRKTGIEVNADNLFYRKWFPGDLKACLICVIDGRLDPNKRPNAIIEIKNRTKPLTYKPICQQDYIQVQVNMALTKTTECDFVQVHNNDIHIQTISFDKKIWKDIATKTFNYVIDFRKITSETNLDDENLLVLREHILCNSN